MFEKTRKFVMDHGGAIKRVAIGVGCVILGGVVYVLCNNRKQSTTHVFTPIDHDTENMHELFAAYNAVYKNGFDVPFVNEEYAIRFMKDRGKTYQIDVFDLGSDCESSCIWISK